MTITPIKLELLLHVYYASSASFTHPAEELYEKLKQELVSEGLIETTKNVCKYGLTANGSSFMQQVLNTPLPEKESE